MVLCVQVCESNCVLTLSLDVSQRHGVVELAADGKRQQTAKGGSKLKCFIVCNRPTSYIILHHAFLCDEAQLRSIASALRNDIVAGS